MSLLPKEQLENICKLYSEKERCRYLTFGGEGYHCMKFNKKAKEYIDKRTSEGFIPQKPVNCEGYKGEEKDVE